MKQINVALTIVTVTVEMEAVLVNVIQYDHNQI